MDGRRCGHCIGVEARDAEAEYAVAQVRLALEPVGAAAVAAEEEPAAAAKDLERSRRRALGIDRVALRLGEPVRAPFKDVPVHVVEAPGVRLVSPDLVGLVVAVLVVPRHFRQHSAPGERRAAARAAGVLPLRLCGEPRLAAERRAHALYERLAVVPRDVLHGTVRVLEAGVVAPHHAFPLTLRDLVLAEPEALRERHGMEWLVGEASGFAGRASHLELPWPAPDHLHLCAARERYGARLADSVILLGRKARGGCGESCQHR